MYISKICLTGLDEYTDLNKVLTIVKRYPNVIFGVLFSYKNKETRYPSPEYIKSIIKLMNDNNIQKNFAIHLCGKETINDFIYSVDSVCKDLTNHFKIIQLNFRSNLYDINDIVNCFKNNSDKTIITQYNVVNKSLYADINAIEHLPNHRLLIDYSGGRGIYKSPVESLSNTPFIDTNEFGLVGGIGADNIEEVVKDIQKFESDKSVWIDAESKLRVDDKFNLNICYEILSKHNHIVREENRIIMEDILNLVDKDLDFVNKYLNETYFSKSLPPRTCGVILRTLYVSRQHIKGYNKFLYQSYMKFKKDSKEAFVGLIHHDEKIWCSYCLRNIATWWYAPHYDGKDDFSDFYCGDCVPRGCSCNSELKAGLDYIHDSDGNTINPESDYDYSLEADGRKSPCIEYDYSKKGFHIYDYLSIDK